MWFRQRRRVIAGLALTAGIAGVYRAALVAQATQVHVWMTTGDRSLLLAPQPDTVFAAPGAAGPITIAVDDSQQFQQIAGFGASMTESSAWLLSTVLSSQARATWMSRLFSPTDGIGLSFLRQPIGASDFSLSHYTYDDVPYGSSDEGLLHFSTARDEAYVFPALREAKRLNPQLAIMASPWSPPGWMKTSGTVVGGALKPEAYAPFASYLVRTVQAYNAQGIAVDAITLQNEPHYVPEDYPGSYLDAPEQARLIGQHVGPAFAAAGLGTRILAWDQNWNDPDYPGAVLQDAAAAQYTSGAAYHCYAGEPAEMTNFHERFPQAHVYVTECSTGVWSVTSFDTALYEDMRLLIRSTRNWAEAVVKWNLALDQDGGPHTGGCTTCTALLTVNSVSGAVTPTADYYALGHLSRFVRPGARRIASSTFESEGIESVAFRNADRTRALIVWNGWGARRLRVSWNGSAFDYDMPGDAVATFTWNDSGDVPQNPLPATNAFPVPGTMEAESFADGAGIGYHDASGGNAGGEYRSTDVDIERTTDTGGGYNVGWISPGEWLAYPISVGSSGTYRFDARVAAYGPGGTFHLEIDGAAATNAMLIPNTAGWQNWTTVSTNLSLGAGLHTARIVFDTAGSTGIVGNLNAFSFSSANASNPYGGVRASVPGRIEAERFDEGDDGIAYHDIDSANFGGQLRATGVDIEPTTDAGAGYNVGWMAPGEWLGYSITAAIAAAYQLDVRVASLGPGGTFHIEIDGTNVTGPLSIQDTGAWQNWTTLSRSGIQISAGAHVLRLVVDTASANGIVGNVNWISAR
jgi:glucosylceramidase